MQFLVEDLIYKDRKLSKPTWPYVKKMNVPQLESFINSNKPDLLNQ